MLTDLFKKAHPGCSVGTEHREAGAEKGPRLEDSSRRVVRCLGCGSEVGRKGCLWTWLKSAASKVCRWAGCWACGKERAKATSKRSGLSTGRMAVPFPERGKTGGRAGLRGNSPALTIK